MPMRPYAGSHDLRRMLDALMAWQAEEPSGDYEHVGDVLWSFRRETGPERNIRLWEEDGRLLGFVKVDPDWGVLLIQVKPDVQEHLRRELFDWGLQTLKAAGVAEITVQVREDNQPMIDFVEAEGFTRGDHDLVELHRSLDGSLEVPPLPPGFSIRAFAGEDEVGAYVDMHRDAWSVWAPSTYSVEEHLRLIRQPGYVPELNPVVVAPDSRLAAYCIGWLDPVNRVGEIEPLGTRPAYARMGLAREVVLEVLRRMWEHGMQTALVYGTRSNEPAWKLYESAGFRPGRVIYNYHREAD